MRKLGVLAVILSAVVCASAQSLKPGEPYPLKPGINQATSDSLVGTHYWYFYATPGDSKVTVRLKNATTLYGANLNTILTVTLSDEKRAWRSVKTITSKPNQTETIFAADKVAKRMKIVVSVAPPNQNLIRMGGDYEIVASGDVDFGEASAASDPIVRTYDSKTNNYGATRFLADGSVVASDGSTGTWKAFDPDNHIYTVQIGVFKYSVQYLPGYGLVNPSEPTSIVFQELRR